MQSRELYFDFLRGVAIIGVVALHATPDGLLFGNHSFNFNFTIIWRQLTNFSVPLFLILSGYFMAGKTIETWTAYSVFLKKQISKVYIPILLWSLAWLIRDVFFLDKPVGSELIKLFTFQSSGAYYFVFLIIQYYVLLPLFQKMATVKGVCCSLFISIFSALAIFFVRYHVGVELPLLCYAGLFPTWMMFFVYGLYLGKGERFALGNSVLLVVTILFFSYSLAETYYIYLQLNDLKLAVSTVKPSSFLFAFSLATLFFNNKDFLRSELLARIGRASFGIYLAHVLIIIFVNDLFRQVVGLDLYQPLYQGGIVLLTIALCLALHAFFHRILPARSIKMLGFA